MSDFENVDVVDLTKTGVSFEDFDALLEPAVEINGGVMIALGEANSLFLAGVLLADLSEANFLFTAAEPAP